MKEWEDLETGRQLKTLNFEFDLVFTSVLNWSIYTAWQEWVSVETSNCTVCDIPLDMLSQSESLKVVLERLLCFRNERIAPEVLSGKTVLISAHGNSSRALLKHLEGTSFTS